MICGLRTHCPFSSLRTGTHFGDEGFRLHLIGAPHLAADAVPHGIFHAQKPREEIRSTPTGADPCRGPAWPKMARSEAIARSQASPDFLSSRNPHPVHTADHRLLAHQDRVHHVIEELHVGPVLFRAACCNTQNTLLYYRRCRRHWGLSR